MQLKCAAMQIMERKTVCDLVWSHQLRLATRLLVIHSAEQNTITSSSHSGSSHRTTSGKQRHMALSHDWISQKWNQKAGSSSLLLQWDLRWWWCCSSSTLHEPITSRCFTSWMVRSIQEWVNTMPKGKHISGGIREAAVTDLWQFGIKRCFFF